MISKWIQAKATGKIRGHADSRPLPPQAIAAVTELLLFLFICEPFLSEFRYWWDSPGIPYSILLISAVVALVCFRKRRWNWFRWMRFALVFCVALNWAAAVYSSGNWPVHRKIAEYVVVWSVYFFHIVSLYAVTWIPFLRFPDQRGMWIHSVLFACMGGFLVADLEYFRFSSNHVGLGYIRLFLQPDTISHMGVSKGFWIVPAVKMGLIAIAAAWLPLFEIRRKRAA